jgi:UDPglucose 6-dehydrogenase
VSARLCVVGAGRSGAVTAACLADLGHSVCAVDVDAARVASLQGGKAPFYEPRLDELIRRNLDAARLSFTTAFGEALPGAGFVLLSVDTPSRSNGEADLSSLSAAVRQLAPLLPKDALVITRSTVPVGTNAWLAAAILAENPQAAFEVVSNPEFLREGHAVDDFMQPERIVIGARTPAAAQAVARLYDSVASPIVFTDLATAELIKYAANAFLATSVSFINEIANICERVGADISVVSQALALDRRVGPHAYLAPGIGFGGSCLPKDLRALITTAEQHEYTPPLLKAVVETNELQPQRVISLLRETFSDLSALTVAVLGISFKGDTFDARNSPALAVIRLLAEEGVRVRAYDPLADGTVQEHIGALAQLCSDAYEAAEGCHALVVATNHSHFLELDLERLGRAMASPVLIDGRNLFDPELATRAGFAYAGIGRPRRGE